MLTHPFTVVVTEYEPATDTVMDGVVAPLLHNSVPVALVVRVELPQLFTTVTTGVAGLFFGVTTTLDSLLKHPFMVVLSL